MMNATLLVLLSLSSLVVFAQCHGGIGFDPLEKLVRTQWPIHRPVHTSTPDRSTYSPVYVGPQDGLKEANKIKSLPGQPEGVNFDHYSGYVTVDPTAGRALFYYFVESPQDSSKKPLVLWLNGGPGCSSLGNGAMMALGPFRVKSDGKTLYRNGYSWINVANVIFLESPAGVGFSYSNTTSDYDKSGDKRTAEDAYTFLVNWLERFPEYKTRGFYITGESYAGHYIPQLAQAILHNNKNTNQTVINLRGVAIGNGWIDFETGLKGLYDNYWTHALISDEINEAINTNCNFSSGETVSNVCLSYLDQADAILGNIFIYDIYASLCFNSSRPPSVLDPCSENYVHNYLNLPQVQHALHANVTSLPYPWDFCNDYLFHHWKDSPLTVLPIIQELMDNGIRVWIYSGDTDGIVPTTSSRYSINKLGPSIKTSWYPWYHQGEVGGFAVGYQNLTFMTIRGSGHFVPFYKPARALVLISSFLDGKLPPSQ